MPTTTMSMIKVGDAPGEPSKLLYQQRRFSLGLPKCLWPSAERNFWLRLYRSTEIRVRICWKYLDSTNGHLRNWATIGHNLSLGLWSVGTINCQISFFWSTNIRKGWPTLPKASSSELFHLNNFLNSSKTTSNVLFSWSTTATTPFRSLAILNLTPTLSNYFLQTPTYLPTGNIETLVYMPFGII